MPRILKSSSIQTQNLLREIKSHQEHLDAVKERMSERSFEEAAGSIEDQVDDLEKRFLELDRRARDRLDRTEQALEEVRYTFSLRLDR